MFRFEEGLLKSGLIREQRATALSVLSSALQAVDPGRAVKRFLRREGHLLTVAGIPYDLQAFDRVLVVGGGKAGAAMAAAVEEVLADRISGGVVNVKYGHLARVDRVRICQ